MPRNVELDHDETMTPHVRSITLVRHGRTAYNAQHRLQGPVSYTHLTLPTILLV